MIPRFNKRTSRPNGTAGFSKTALRRPRDGFTLIELLLVVAIIALLAGLLFPALARSKARAHALVCMNNARQLTFAWTLYSGDNNDHLVYNLGANVNSNSPASLSPVSAQPNWVNNTMDWTTNPENTNNGFVSTSLLAPYSGYSVPIYKCPADRILSSAQINAGFTARVRSFSMNAMVGDPGALLAGGQNVNNPGYRQFLKETEIPNPSDIFVLLDEHPDSIDDGYFIDRYSTSLEWIDLPASYHDGGANFSYADGHTALHTWIYDSTRPPSVPEGAHLPLAVDPDETSDFYWVLKHMSVYTGN